MADEIVLVQNDASLIAQGANVIAGALLACEVALVKDDIAIDADTLFADLETSEADYNTYAREVVTWGPATISDDGEIEYLGAVGEFRPTDALAPNSIYGLFVANSGGTDTLMQCRFPVVPLPMETVLDAIQITLRYRPGSDSLAVLIS